MIPYKIIMLLILSSLGITFGSLLDRYISERYASHASRRWALVGIMISTLIFPFIGLMLPIDALIGEHSSSVLGTTGMMFMLDEVVVSTTKISEQDGIGQSIITYLLYVWGIGIVVRLVLLAWQAISLARIVAGAELISHYDGIAVLRLRRDVASPFSTMGKIYLPHTLPESDELAYILRHEAVHIRQWHIVDVLIGKLFTCIHWYHPIARDLCRRLVDVHEYIADDAVLSDTHISRRQYQLYLLKIAMDTWNVSLCHSFNSNNNQLKKRIIMMNEIKANRRAKWSWLVATPVALLMLFGGTFLATAQSQEQTQVRETQTEATPQEKQKFEGHKPDKNGVYEIVDVQPEFPGGKEKMFAFLAQNIRYPKESQDKNEEGKVLVSFVVQTNGSLSQIKVVKSVTPSLDKEALRVVKLMPKWTVGKTKGKAVPTRMKLPISFKLQ